MEKYVTRVPQAHLNIDDLRRKLQKRHLIIILWGKELNAKVTKCEALFYATYYSTNQK